MEISKWAICELLMLNKRFSGSYFLHDKFF